MTNTIRWLREHFSDGALYDDLVREPHVIETAGVTWLVGIAADASGAKCYMVAVRGNVRTAGPIFPAGEKSDRLRAILTRPVCSIVVGAQDLRDWCEPMDRALLDGVPVSSHLVGRALGEEMDHVRVEGDRAGRCVYLYGPGGRWRACVMGLDLSSDDPTVSKRPLLPAELTSGAVRA